jgi:hypothetical protein
MKTFFHPLTETEQTAWILIAVLLALFLAFGYLFWQRISTEWPQILHPGVQIMAVLPCAQHQ